jgi:DNA-binding CsgD family transcriptional regulator
VEVLGRYSNLSNQVKRIHEVLGIVPEGTSEVNVRTPKQVQHRLRPAEIEQLKQAYESGATLRDLARGFQINRGTAAELLEREGLTRRGKGPSESDVQEAITLYEAGLSTAKIGQSLGFSADTIRNRLVAKGVRIRDPRAWRHHNPNRSQ